MTPEENKIDSEETQEEKKIDSDERIKSYTIMVIMNISVIIAIILVKALFNSWIGFIFLLLCLTPKKQK